MVFRGWATGVGSVPHLDVRAACRFVLQTYAEVPFWPQFPKVDLREQMYLQFAEGFPRERIQPAKGRLVLDTSGDLSEDLAAFYEKILAEDVDAFAMSPGHARGLWTMLELLDRERPSSVQIVKGQVTGPVSFGLAVTDQANRSVIFHDQVSDAVVQGLTMRARWQARTLRSLGLPVLICVDEPYLVSLGSGYIPLERDRALRLLKTTVEGIRNEGCLVCLHCCGGTDWSLVIEAAPDVINFDAFDYFETLVLYPRELRQFLESGGTLAWGIVPSSDVMDSVTLEELVEKWHASLRALEERGVPRELMTSSFMVTASCGVGTLPVATAERALRTAAQLSEVLREEMP
jgi:methionine synthase II (cobalamin-independent)